MSGVQIPSWDASELDVVVSSGRVILADLRADWCAQCGPQEQVLLRLAPEFDNRILVGSVDVGVHPEVAERHEVMTLPSMLLFSHGRLQKRLTGFKRAPVLREAVGEVLRTT